LKVKNRSAVILKIVVDKAPGVVRADPGPLTER